MNHEFTPGVLKNALDEVEGESAKSVAVGHHNLLDVSVHDPVQKGREARALPVNARSDVFDDLVLRIFRAEQVDLALEVLFLLGAGDAGVADLRALVSELPLRDDLEAGDDVVEIVFPVEALAPAGTQSHGADESVVSPPLERGVADAEALADLGAGDVLGAVVRSGAANAGKCLSNSVCIHSTETTLRMKEKIQRNARIMCNAFVTRLWGERDSCDIFAESNYSNAWVFPHENDAIVAIHSSRNSRNARLCGFGRREREETKERTLGRKDLC